MNQAGIDEIRAQRNQAFDMLANSAARIAELEALLQQANAEIAALKAAKKQS